MSVLENVNWFSLRQTTTSSFMSSRVLIISPAFLNGINIWPNSLCFFTPILFSDNLNESVATKTTPSSSEDRKMLESTGLIVETEELYITDLNPFIKPGTLKLKVFSFETLGMFGKSSTGKALIIEFVCFVDIFKLSLTTSSVMFLSFVMFEIKLYNTEPDTAVFPGLITFTGSVISIPRSRLVAFIVKSESCASNKTQLKIGRVMFLPVILSAFEIA